MQKKNERKTVEILRKKKLNITKKVCTLGGGGKVVVSIKVKLE